MLPIPRHPPGHPPDKSFPVQSPAKKIVMGGILAAVGLLGIAGIVIGRANLVKTLSASQCKIVFGLGLALTISSVIGVSTSLICSRKKEPQRYPRNQNEISETSTSEVKEALPLNNNWYRIHGSEVKDGLKFYAEVKDNNAIKLIHIAIRAKNVPNAPNAYNLYVTYGKYYYIHEFEIKQGMFFPLSMLTANSQAYKTLGEYIHNLIAVRENGVKLPQIQSYINSQIFS